MFAYTQFAKTCVPPNQEKNEIYSNSNSSVFNCQSKDQQEGKKLDYSDCLSVWRYEKRLESKLTSQHTHTQIEIRMIVIVARERDIPINKHPQHDLFRFNSRHSRIWDCKPPIKMCIFICYTVAISVLVVVVVVVAVVVAVTQPNWMEQLNVSPIETGVYNLIFVATPI